MKRSVFVDALLAMMLVGGIAGSWLAQVPPGLSFGTAQADQYGALYLHDALHRALMAGRFPLVDHEQLWPVGAPLAAMNGDNVMEMLASGVLRCFLGFPAWFDVAHVVWFPLLAASFVPLAARLWDGETWVDRAFRVSAAASWALSPVLLGEAVAGRLTQVVLVGVPLAVMRLHAATMGPSGARGRVFGAVGLALTGLGYWYYAIFLGILAPVFLLVTPRARWRTFLVEAGWMGIGALLLVSPALGGIVWSSWSLHVSPSLPVPPGGLSPVFDNALQLARSQPTQLQGWFVWALAPRLALLVWASLRKGGGWLWLLLSAVCLCFALGPGQRLGGRLWLLPYYPLWRVVPTLARLTHPSRWLDFGMIFLVIASFDGLRRAGARAAAPLVLVGLVGQATSTDGWRIPSFEVPRSPMYAEAANTAGALIILPVMHAPDTLRYTLIHHRAVLGGMAEGLPWSWPPAFRAWFESNRFLLQLLALGDGKLTTLDLRQGDLDALRTAGFSQVLWDAEAWAKWRHRAGPEVVSIVSEALGSPAWTGPEGAIWDLPGQAASGEAAVLPGVRLPAP